MMKLPVGDNHSIPTYGINQKNHKTLEIKILNDEA